MAEYDSEEYRLVSGKEAGTAVSPTSIDEKEDTIEGARRSGLDDSMVIVNPIAQKHGYDYPNANVKLTEEDLADLSEHEKEAFERITKREEREKTESDDEEYVEINRKSEKYYETLKEEFDVFPATLSAFDDGDFTLELKKRYMLKAIDEKWIVEVEKRLTALDTIIRSPTKFIEQNEQVLPIELSKRISPRSLQHLGQHTNLISKIEGDEITPSKILNVFNDETMLTYENKFINTLVNRLYVFIAKRYQAAVKSGRDEKATMLDFGGRFRNGKVRGKVNFSVEIAEEPEDNVQLKNYYFTTDLWHRVEKLYKIVQNYMASDFVTSMGKAFIRPPVMRTNAILRNKNMRQCLELWEFIEGYENLGYEMLIQETAEDINDKYKKTLYNDAVLQFLLFRYNVKNDFNDEETLSQATTDLPLAPKLISAIKPFDADDFNVFDPVSQKTVTVNSNAPQEETNASEREIEQAIDLVLTVSELYDGCLAEEKERIRIEEERRRAEEEKKRLEEERRRREEEERRLEEERRRLEEEKRLEEERVRKELEEAERARLAKEKEEAEKAAAEAKRLEDEAKAAEEARIEAEKKAKEEKAAAEEAERLARRERNKKVSRKKKKKIRTAASKKAAIEGVKLSKTFDIDEYTRYLESENKEKDSDENN